MSQGMLVGIAYHHYNSELDPFDGMSTSALSQKMVTHWPNGDCHSADPICLYFHRAVSKLCHTVSRYAFESWAPGSPRKGQSISCELYGPFWQAGFLLMEPTFPLGFWLGPILDIPVSFLIKLCWSFSILLVVFVIIQVKMDSTCCSIICGSPASPLPNSKQGSVIQKECAGWQLLKVCGSRIQEASAPQWQFPAATDSKQCVRWWGEDVETCSSIGLAGFKVPQAVLRPWLIE